MPLKNILKKLIDMGKFKVGELVITSEFDDVRGPDGKMAVFYVPFMDKYVGKPGRIEAGGYSGRYYVHGWWWPESALLLVYEEKPNLPAVIEGKVTSVEQLYSLAQMKKSVKLPWMRLPAAVVINWQGALLVRMISKGDISIYKPKEKKGMHKAFENK